MKKIRMLSAYEFNGRKLEHVTRQISADAVISANLLTDDFIRLIVEGPTENFEVECISFVLGEPIDVISRPT